MILRIYLRLFANSGVDSRSLCTQTNSLCAPPEPVWRHSWRSIKKNKTFFFMNYEGVRRLKHLYFRDFRDNISFIIKPKFISAFPPKILTQ